MAFIISLGFLSGCSNSLENNDSSTVINDDLDWNYEDLDVSTNGNIQIAAKLVKSDDLQDVFPVEPAVVVKTPWNYYGKVLELSGTIELIEDYPPGGDISQVFGGGSVSEVVFMTEDGTIADFFMIGSSGNLNVGDMVTLRGYPVGRNEVENKLGGSFTHLILVGKISTDIEALNVKEEEELEPQTVGWYTAEEAISLVDEYLNEYGSVMGYDYYYYVTSESEGDYIVGCYLNTDGEYFYGLTEEYSVNKSTGEIKYIEY